jgi:phosphoribosylanthranilate isomerase
VAATVRARVGQVIKVFPAGSPAASDIDRYDVDAVMLDGVVPGSGEIFDWALVDVVPDDVPFILAGGLTPDNVVAAIEHVRPWGVDVATGVESSPGHKDPIKVRDFIRAAKGE